MHGIAIKAWTSYGMHGILMERMEFQWNAWNSRWNAWNSHGMHGISGLWLRPLALALAVALALVLA